MKLKNCYSGSFTAEELFYIIHHEQFNIEDKKHKSKLTKIKNQLNVLVTEYTSMYGKTRLLNSKDNDYYINKLSKQILLKLIMKNKSIKKSMKKLSMKIMLGKNHKTIE